MEWTSLLNASRLGESRAVEENDDVRSQFERDADRIIYSGSFRRLSRKTQVHPLAANDHVHNRLTHSLETGQVGKALGKRIHAELINELPTHISAADISSIIQAACLAHDIGNPPFGHAGEEAMVHWFASNSQSFGNLSDTERYDIGRFDGNAQGFRILTQVENHLFKGGLRLTYATLATFLKYPRVANPDLKKFSVFRSEQQILDEVAAAVGLPMHDGTYARHPLAYLVEAADDICYCVLDLEDAVELKILSFEEVKELLLKPLDPKEKERITRQFAGSAMFRVNLARMRGPVFKLLINAAVEGFLKSYTDIMAGRPVGDVFTALGEGDVRARVISEAKEIGRKKIYVDARKVEVELGAFATLDALLTDLFAAARECAYKQANEQGPELGWRTRLILGLLGDHAPRKENPPPSGPWTEYLSYRRAVDFVSGMTDNYATYLAKQLKGMGFTGLQRP